MLFSIGKVSGVGLGYAVVFFAASGELRGSRGEGGGYEAIGGFSSSGIYRLRELLVFRPTVIRHVCEK